MNVIHDNVTGIHVLSGAFNKFGFNLNYDNKPLAAPKGVAKDAITLETGANEDLIPLEIVMFEEEGVEHALVCTRDGDGNVIKRQFTFETPQLDGIISIYQAESYNQADRYLTSCELDDGVCVIENLPADVLDLIPDKECGIEDYFVNALFTGTSSTELMANPAELDGVVAFVSTPYDIPSTGNIEGDDGGDQDDTGGNSAGGDGVITEGDDGGGVIAAGASSGCSGGGASLANNSFRHIVFGFNAWWVILALAIAGAYRFAAVRVKSKRRDP